MTVIFFLFFFFFLFLFLFPNMPRVRFGFRNFVVVFIVPHPSQFHDLFYLVSRIRFNDNPFNPFFTSFYDPDFTHYIFPVQGVLQKHICIDTILGLFLPPPPPTHTHTQTHTRNSVKIS
ncbi:hypothetical protein GGR50DRAFT_659302 [Xylaria sp. CBS 124048]|nr:hypothetical protein GGR50DRAFT_659302 [Xylaria sp. CBS 124048]